MNHDQDGKEQSTLKVQQSAISEVASIQKSDFNPEDVECRSIYISSALHIEYGTVWMLSLCPFLKALPTAQSAVDDEEEMKSVAATSTEGTL